MATHSYICIEQPNGDILGVYCHNDGYLSNNGNILFNYYQERSKVERLLSFGSMSSLGAEIDPNRPHDFYNRQYDVCYFYCRDRGETLHPAIILNGCNLDDIEYIYIYGLDNKWRYCFDLNDELILLTPENID